MFKIENRQSGQMPTYPQLLMELMSDISEDHYCAGWILGNEVDLWGIMTGDIFNEFGFNSISEYQLRVLKDLHQKTDGWVIYVSEDELEGFGIKVPEGANPYLYTGEYFVTTEEWLVMYRNYKDKAIGWMFDGEFIKETVNRKDLK